MCVCVVHKTGWHVSCMCCVVSVCTRVSVCTVSCGHVEAAQTLRVCCEASDVFTTGQWKPRKRPWDPQRSRSKQGGAKPDLPVLHSTRPSNSACVQTKTLAPALCPAGSAPSLEPLLSSVALFLFSCVYHQEFCLVSVVCFSGSLQYLTLLRLILLSPMFYLCCNIR